VRWVSWACGSWTWSCLFWRTPKCGCKWARAGLAGNFKEGRPWARCSRWGLVTRSTRWVLFCRVRWWGRTASWWDCSWGVQS
jgi:hypothetical protein